MSPTGTPDTGPMATALEAARRALAAGEAPVGACLVEGDTVLAVTHTAVIGEVDATAHAEIRAIRTACRARRSLRLPDAVLYTTVEPCAMCLAACHYAGISHVVYGASLDDFRAVTGRELRGPVPPGFRLEADAAAAEACRALLTEWRGLRRIVPEGT